MNFVSLFTWSTIFIATSAQISLCKEFNDFEINFAATSYKPKISLKIVFTEPSDISKCSASILTVKCRFSITFSLICFTFSSMLYVDGRLERLSFSIDSQYSLNKRCQSKSLPSTDFHHQMLSE